MSIKHRTDFPLLGERELKETFDSIINQTGERAMNDHNERAAEMLAEIEAIEQARKEEARRAEEEQRRAAARAAADKKWAAHRAATRTALEPAVAALQPRAAALGLKLRLRESPTAIDLVMATPNDAHPDFLSGVTFEERPIYSGRYSFRSSGVRLTARVSKHGAERNNFPQRKDGSFSYDKIAAAMIDGASVLLAQMEHGRRDAEVRARHAEAFAELKDVYGLRSKYDSTTTAHNAWYTTERSPAMGRLDVELELIPSDTTPFRVKLPQGITLTAAQAQALFNLLRRFHNESKE